MFINKNTNQFSTEPHKGEGWERVSVDQFNAERAKGYNPTEAPPLVPTLEARIAALEAKQKLIEPDVSTLKTDVETLKATR